MATLALSALLSYLGCAPDTRYKVLSFFFDGVPSPNGEEQPKKVVGPWGVPLEPDNPLAAEYAAAQARQPPPAPEPVSTHAPWKNRDCFACHEAESSLVTAKGGDSLCRKCHTEYLDPAPADWVHGPVALGQCSLCHEPHKSQYPALLKGPERDLCRRCHAETSLAEMPVHRSAGDKECSACHDPHMSGSRLLLVDSGTFRRRHVDRLPAVEHAPWKDRKCTACHVPEQSNAVVADIDKVCLSCHAKVRDEAKGGKLHQAVADGKCVACHAPHKSPLPGLVRTTAEKMCLSCHKIEEVRKPDHPPVGRADCLLCHRGHTSDRDHLLKKDIPWPPAPPGVVAQSARPGLVPEDEVEPARPEP
jgi:predicted CXXCH cytochrome family protein